MAAVARYEENSAARYSGMMVMTAAQSAHQWAQEVGADGFVATPFDLDTMRGEVERLCTAREREDTRRTP